MDHIAQDLRFAIRTLLKTPGFALVVIVTLALGVGANAAIFSITDQLLLRWLPVAHPEELVSFENPGAFSGRSENKNTFSYPMYREFRDKNSVFSGIVASFPFNVTLAAGGPAERATGDLVTGNYFDVLGVRPYLGRTFTRDDDRLPGGHPIVILSYGFWQRRFAGDARVLNRSVTLNGHPMTIVGVAPPGFFGISIGATPDVMVPMMMKAEMTPTWNDLDNPRSRWLVLLARLKPGVSIDQAEAGINVLYRQINEEELKTLPDASERFRKNFVAKHLFVRPGARGRSDLRDEFSTPIIVLMGMVGLVLLIACANVANLLLARGAARHKEVAIRLALGASRAAIVRQRLVESLLLSLIGGAIGVPFAWWATGLLVKALPSDGAAAHALRATPDLRVVLFALAVSIVTAVLFGLAPALHSSKPALTSTLKDESGSIAGGGTQARFRKGLVIAQVALSVLLLAGAALFARSLFNLKNLNPGFQTEHLLSFSVEPALSGYTEQQALRIFDRVQKQISAVPGVVSTAASSIPLMTNSEWSATVRVEGYEAKEGENMNPEVNAVGPDYFSTMGQPLIMGREFTERDAAGAPKVAIINETMAKYYFPDKNPLGRHIGWRRNKDIDIEIVGVVKDAKSATLRDKIERFVYSPYMQEDGLTQMTFYVRARGEVTTMASAVRAAVQQIDSNLPIFEMKTMDQQLDESLFIERMVAALSVTFGALATLLAAIGLYGVMSYSVARRTREIGIRMALGAERASVLWLVLREVSLLVSAGLIVGVPVSLALGRLVQSQLFELSSMDPMAIGAATALLAGVALMAGYLPARRATRVDPMLALRYQ